MIRSGIEIRAAERTFLGFFHPLLDAASMENMFARQSHNEFVFFEALNAYGARFGTFLHDKRFDPIDLRQILVFVS